MMRTVVRTLVLSVVFACSGGSKTPVEKPNTAPLKIPIRAVQVGDVVEVEETEKLSATGEVKLETNSRQRKRAKVIAVDEGRVIKLSVTYLEHHHSMLVNGVEKSEVPALTGKTSVVETVDGKVMVTNESGELTDREKEAILDDYSSFGNKSSVPQEIVKREWKIGVPVNLDFPEVTGKFTITLLEYDDKHARFSTAVNVIENGITVEMRGHIDVDIADPSNSESTVTSKLTGNMTGTRHNTQRRRRR